MKNTSTYKINNIKKLIDLNGDLTNFDLNFTAQSKNNEPFEAIVVDQSTLDSNEKLEYKMVTDGVISANVNSDKNIYQNYYLLLKSDTPCDVDVSIEVNEITVENSENVVPQDSLPDLQNDEKQSLFSKFMPKFKMKISWKTILIVVLVLGSIIFLYLKFFKNKDKSKDVSNDELEIDDNDDEDLNLDFKNNIFKKYLNFSSKSSVSDNEDAVESVKEKPISSKLKLDLAKEIDTSDTKSVLSDAEILNTKVNIEKSDLGISQIKESVLSRIENLPDL